MEITDHYARVTIKLPNALDKHPAGSFIGWLQTEYYSRYQCYLMLAAGRRDIQVEFNTKSQFDTELPRIQEIIDTRWPPDGAAQVSEPAKNLAATLRDLADRVERGDLLDSTVTVNVGYVKVPIDGDVTLVPTGARQFNIDIALAWRPT